MKIVKILALTIIISVLIIPSVLAENYVISEEEELHHAIGFAGGMTGGTGLSYKYLLNQKEMFQFTGGLIGSSNDYLDYNFGVQYQKILYETSRTRLFFAPGFSWRQKFDLNKEDDITSYEYRDPETEEIIEASYSNNRQDSKVFFAGLTYGIEFKFDHVGLGFFVGYGGFLENQPLYGPYDTLAEAEKRPSQTDYGFNLTGDVALFYYF